ncbi:aspartate/glutamate racemase family protein [Brevibacillus nitrificans]|uniref:aspartate/glutamate racemase family protein n=1 Tax=Brevibacillus nitrificans TaxID=651560 RepID=UPI00285E82AA|nr:aspartate/glutamate racemase family protein [Brevibacillus nitrificans]MDR7319265.1 Asp/Glu/hydantoin racemase [Brevibacillus nitrificans]
MKTRIGLVHATMNSVSPMLEAFHTHYPEAELVNLMDEGLLLAVNEQGGITPEILRRFEDLVQKAVDSGTDGVLLSCSVFSPYVPDIQKKYAIPILSVDEAMLARAVLLGERIGVVATVGTAGPTTKGLLEQFAQASGKAIQVDVEIVPEAFAALKRGDGKRHNHLVQERAKRLAENADVLVLAQISMARAAAELKEIGIPVLTSPLTSTSSIIEQIRARKGLE